ncbi:MAG: sensor histidine kinase [Chloroflexi bacterium]|nr:sensor histidine kinase [Chloroflexota bacterium]
MIEIKRAWEHAPILERVLIGNAVVILVGAIGGTFITSALVHVSGIALALFFSTVGILLSLLINSYILQSALQPMHVLQRTVEEIDRGDAAVRAPVDEIGDPQLKRLAQALNTMLERLAAHTRMIEANQVQLRSLSGQVLSAQEDERKRIARELHDDTSGSLARVLLNIEMCEEALPADADSVRGKMQDTRVIVEQTLDNVRQMIFGLRPALLDDLGLAAAVRWYAKSSLEPAGIQVQFDASSNLGRAAPTIETALFRIAQEAMTNVVRHASARHVRVQLTREETNVVLLVQDDGTGFQAEGPEVTASTPQHWGLFGVAERVQLLGGTLNVDSGIGRGTLLRVQVPLA